LLVVIGTVETSENRKRKFMPTHEFYGDPLHNY